MIISCDSCAANLQLDEKKAPSDNFTIRCPKCSNLVRVRLNGESGNGNHTPAQNGQSNVNGTEQKNWEAPQKAAAYKSSEKAEENGSNALSSAGSEQVLKLLANLLQ